MDKPKKTYHAIWRFEADPLYSVECPHCKSMLIMSRESLITRLKKWAKQAKELIK